MAHGSLVLAESDECGVLCFRSSVECGKTGLPGVLWELLGTGPMFAPSLGRTW